MKYAFLVMLAWLGLSQVAAQAPEAGPDLKLWYDRPAKIWEEALPLGNGKTGAMVFGRVNKERLQLNDNTLWSGFPNAGNNPKGPAHLPLVRQATFSLWNSEAAMQQYAYGTAHHQQVIRKTRADRWYKEELFARFRVLSSSGTWNGRNPLDKVLEP